MTTPNQYLLHRNGLSVAYYPNGQGPVINGNRTVLVYQNGSDAPRTFSGDQVGGAPVGDLGSLVTVSLSGPLLLLRITFGVFIPSVEIPDGSKSVSVHTVGITKTQSLVEGVDDTFSVTELSGSARVVIVDLLKPSTTASG